jgi:hypothetical protein
LELFESFKGRCEMKLKEEEFLEDRNDRKIEEKYLEE